MRIDERAQAKLKSLNQAFSLIPCQCFCGVLGCFSATPVDSRFAVFLFLSVFEDLLSLALPWRDTYTEKNNESFFSGYFGFPLSSKTNISKFQFDLEFEGHRFVSVKSIYFLEPLQGWSLATRGSADPRIYV